MFKSLVLMLLATAVLTACETSQNIDPEQLERENRQILRQLGGD